MKNMNPRFKNCLERNQIYEDPNAKNFAQKELSAAEQDLSDAQINFKENRHKWATIQSYFSMFHAARALLYSQGYRERSHYCLVVAIQSLFVETGKLDASLLKRLAGAKALREKADYELEFSKMGAEKSLRAAEEFIQKVKELTAPRKL